MHVFLTGGTGYVGGAIASRLVREGHSVTGLARSDEAGQRLVELGVEPRSGSLGDAEVLRSAAQQADVVVHAAVDYFDPAFGAVERAALEVLTERPRQLIYTSSTLVLSDTGPHPVPEEVSASQTTLQPFKLAGEQRVLEAGGTVVRLGLVYGRNGSGLLTALLSSAKAQGTSGYVGSGEARWSTVHVDDAAELFARVVVSEKAAGLVVHAVEVEAVTWRAIAEAIARNAGVAAVSLPPEQAAAAGLGPMAEQLTKNLWMVPTRARDHFAWHPVGKGILHDLEYGSYRS
ncbi:NAD-dependent epimerase/dehydratase family protein [Streptomyces albogriseolus]|nr:NAD-dependent epimerase/dehydratase family protein [Streptomyces albogriseolus]